MSIFLPALTGESQLLEFVEAVTAGLDSGLPLDVVVMNFAKAFDRVNHS